MASGTNPYNEMLEIFGRAGSEQARSSALQLYLGIVKSVEPLELTVDGTPQRAADGKIWCNPALLPDYPRKAKLEETTGTIGASVNCGTGAISQLTATGSGTLNTKLTLTDHGFAVGDHLVLLSRDQQTFFILCKEVHL